MVEFLKHFWGFIVGPILGFTIIGLLRLGPERRHQIRTRLKNMPLLVAIRSKMDSISTIIGERTRPAGRGWKEIPEFVLIPKLLQFPIFIRTPLKIAWLILIFFPYFFYWSIKVPCLLVFGFADQRGPGATANPKAFFRQAEIGRTTVQSGGKGGGSEKRKARIAERNSTLIEEAQTLLDEGRGYSFVVGEIWSRYYAKEGYPSDRKQYENILRELQEN